MPKALANSKYGDLPGRAALTHIKSTLHSVPLSIYDFREMDSSGDVGAIAANGGLLASDTTPILRGNAAEVQEIVWAASNNDIIGCQFAVPANIDDSQDVTVELWVNSGGTTDLASFSVLSSWDGAAIVTDTATDTGASTTTHKITATIAAADVPSDPGFVSMQLVPAAHTTDTVAILGVRVTFTGEVFAS